MTEDERAAMLAELIEFSEPRTLQDDEFTTAQFCSAASGLSPQQAQTRLKRLAHAGRVIKVNGKVFDDNRWQTAYRYAKSE